MGKPIKVSIKKLKRVLENKGKLLPLIIPTWWNVNDLDMRMVDDSYKVWLEKCKKSVNHRRKMFVQKYAKIHHIKLLNHSRKTFKRK